MAARQNLHPEKVWHPQRHTCSSTAEASFLKQPTMQMKPIFPLSTIMGKDHFELGKGGGVRERNLK
jgi:hypothetical protein